MHRIDRFHRFLCISRRRALITLVLLSVSFLAFNYAVVYDRNSSLQTHKQFPMQEDTIAEEVLNYDEIASENINDGDGYFSSPNTPTEYLLENISTSEHFLNESNYNENYGESGTGITSDKIDYIKNSDYDKEATIEEYYENNNDTVPIFINDLFAFSCKNVTMRRAQKRNKNLIVYENFIPASYIAKCYESITYTTHADYRYLDNLIPLVERWRGPISVAIYAPADDLKPSLRIISYLRECYSKIRDLVTFHLFFDAKFIDVPVSTELQFQWLDSLYEKERWTDCSKSPQELKDETTFRMRKKLLYPVNIGRNTARSSATTHFVLASDIELYPSVNLIPAFFKMLQDESLKSGRNNKISISSTADIGAKQVFVLPVFEVRKGIKPPKTKGKLLQLLGNMGAIPFHNSICKECHLIPKFEEWKKNASKDENDDRLKIFNVAKRQPPFQFWEPIYIGTKYEPLYDERLSWEGLRDKMTQGYILCALDYNFLILDNAFLVHRPGIKRLSHRITQTVLRQDRLINIKIKSELFKRFGKVKGCTL